ncbi:MAG TPA: hypothetical protein VFR65_00405 [Nitrososphaeraceae archaeon]|nr:hypothetical protein [Nitrososphaeraceae archaeon]
MISSFYITTSSPSFRSFWNANESFDPKKISFFSYATNVGA